MVSALARIESRGLELFYATKFLCILNICVWKQWYERLCQRYRSKQERFAFDIQCFVQECSKIVLTNCASFKSCYEIIVISRLKTIKILLVIFISLLESEDLDPR